MWSLWTKSKTYSQLPSDVWGEIEHPVFGMPCSLAAWMLDSAITWFGITIENALSERVEIKMGTKVQSTPKFTLIRLLDENFRLPPPPEEKTSTNPWSPLMGWLGRGGNKVKRYQYVPPEKGAAEEDNG
jgi:hypothetical protein